MRDENIDSILKLLHGRMRKIVRIIVEYRRRNNLVVDNNISCNVPFCNYFSHEKSVSYLLKLYSKNSITKQIQSTGSYPVINFEIVSQQRNKRLPRSNNVSCIHWRKSRILKMDMTHSVAISVPEILLQIESRAILLPTRRYDWPDTEYYHSFLIRFF